MLRETFPVPPLGCNCSILYDLEARDATVVDPGGDVHRILAFLTRHGLTLKQILITHAHLDHIAGAVQLAESTEAPILYHQADLFQLGWMEQQAAWMGVQPPRVRPPDASAEDGTAVAVGDATGHVLHTPGHTEGSISLHFPSEKLLLAGDTLFRGGVGRTDLPGGDERLILRSIQDRLLVLPEETVVVPGHGRETSIGLEGESNPFLRRA